LDSAALIFRYLQNYKIMSKEFLPDTPGNAWLLALAVEDYLPFPRLLSLRSPAAGTFETIVLDAQRRGELLLHGGAHYPPGCVPAEVDHLSF